MNAHPAEVPSSAQLPDRLAILNLLGIYSAYANDGDLEGWGSLFADDAIFEIHLPDGTYPVDKATLLAGEKHIFQLYRDRKANPASGERRLFLFSNPYVARQSIGDADVGVTMTLVRTSPDGPHPHIEATGTYTGTLVKRENIWLIHRWRVQTDRTPEPMQDGPAHPDAAWEN
ncbi:nuclear transport factor 2 family protein [Sphingobium phenoxybenzoativorans]|uniref:nuclear transport factor 2 family protein n=1 Tax=Sphingobium phenoxybenzoativorans TaxID=1592790 RepID=UPI0008732547|nr:nuclear transport factor 2 family protein [Sphingobium phenoxybenzoativorans]